MSETVRGLDGCATGSANPDKVRLVARQIPAEEEITRVSALFKLLGDATRTRILYALLEGGELCVCDLAAATGTTETTVSQALRLLRASGVVAGRREGRNVFYRLFDAHVRMLLDVTREHTLHEHSSESSTGRSEQLRDAR
ncbi:ArsR/SmtB family transcription factor [Austwickia chelonae]|uniref:ArsR/SmtB family transcription factor n=1 Tax=Austwickia chelonae TaxID=100225 RepID=UPI000E2248A9|nr:metalloregulator ArsR/SmtB family transcription factor [Austwickia chelonae]